MSFVVGTTRGRARLQEPPRHAVHRGQHDRLGAEQRCERGCGLDQRRPLQRDDHEVLRTEGAGVIGGRYRRARLDAVQAQSEPVLAHGRERRTSRERTDVRARAREPRRDQPTHGTQPHHGDLHGRILAARRGGIDSRHRFSAK